LIKIMGCALSTLETKRKTAGIQTGMTPKEQDGREPTTTATNDASAGFNIQAKPCFT